MGTLIGGFQMETYKIVLLQFCPGGLQFAFKIGIQLAGSALNLHHFKAAQYPDSVTQRDSTDHSSVQAVLPTERGQLHCRSLCPEPDAVSRKFSSLTPFLRYRVMLQNAVGQAH